MIEHTSCTARMVAGTTGASGTDSCCVWGLFVGELDPKRLPLHKYYSIDLDLVTPIKTDLIAASYTEIACFN